MANPGYRLYLHRGDGTPDPSDDQTVVIGPDDIMRPNLPRKHTDIDEWELQVPYTRSLNEWRLADAYLEYEAADGRSELIYRGQLDTTSNDQRRAQTTLRGQSIEHKLKSGSSQQHYQGAIVADVIKDYWEEETPFSAVVDTPEPGPIDIAKVVLNAKTTDEFEVILAALDPTEPIVIDDDVVRLADTLYFSEVEDYDSSAFGDDAVIEWRSASGGELGYSFSFIYDWGFDFTPEYTIPEDYVGVAARLSVRFYDYIRTSWQGYGFEMLIDNEFFSGAGTSNGFGLLQSSNSGSELDLDEAGYYDSSDESYDDQAAALDPDGDQIQLFGDNPSVGDAFYFGHDGDFDTLDIELETAAEGDYEIEWQYYAREYEEVDDDEYDTIVTEWRDIPSVSDNTDGFQESGRVEWLLDNIGNDTREGGDYTEWRSTRPDNSVSQMRYVRARIVSIGEIETLPTATTAFGLGCRFIWLTEGGGWSNGDLEAGETYRVELDVLDTDGNGVMFDAVALYDDRYEYNFSNELDAPYGYLPGPELKPEEYTIGTDLYEEEWNVTGATLSLDLSAGSDPSLLRLSNNDGETWDVTAEDSSEASGDFDSIGSLVRSEVTLVRGGEREGQTPLTGFESTAIDEWTVAVDTDDLAIFNDREFAGSDFEILRELHQEAGYNWVIPPVWDDEDLEVHSFPRGSVVKEADWTTKDGVKDGFEMRSYANVVTVFGAYDEKEEEYLVAEARQEDEIQRLIDLGFTEGQAAIEETLIEPDIDNDEDLRRFARQELVSRVNEDEANATIPIVPKIIPPGYAYPVPELEDEGEIPTLTLERTRFRDGSSPSGELQFEDPPDISDVVRSVSTDVRRTKRAIR